MKNGLLKTIVLGVLVAGAMSAGVSRADTIVTVDPTAINLGYMNVSNLPSDGGAYQFGSSWGLADLTAVYSGSNLTLGPNCIGDPNVYWYIGGGAPGAPGNKIMEANCYAQPAASLPGQNVTFLGTVLANTLTPAHHAIAFIKDFAPDFSSYNVVSVPLPTAGTFSITLATVADPARHVQYGFQMTGVNVWVTDLAPFGTVIVGPASPTPTTKTTWGSLKAQYR